MSRNYYYFAASLPHVQFGSKEPISVEDFISDCERLLAADDFKCLAAVLKGEQAVFRNRTAESYTRFEHELKNEFAFQRGEKKGNPSHSVRGTRDISPAARDIAAQAFKASHPLAAEELIDNARWQFLDQLSVGQYYNFDYILIYGLKLKILERHHLFESPKAKEIFENFKNVDDLLVGLI